MMLDLTENERTAVLCALPYSDIPTPGNVQGVIDVLYPIIERQVREQVARDLERQEFAVTSVHHVHGHTCLCGFESARSRSRTEHIIGALDATRITRATTGEAGQ